MRTTTKKVLICTLLVLLASVTACYVFFYSFTPSQKTNSEVTKQKDGVLEKTSVGLHIKAQDNVSIDDILHIATEQVGFHVYYFTSLPNMLVIDRNSIWIGPGDKREIVTYNLTNNESPLFLVSVVQQKVKQGKETVILKGINRLQSPKRFLSDRCIGGLTHAPSPSTHLFCSTEDEVAIWLHSEHFDLDTLVSIAESMR